MSTPVKHMSPAQLIKPLAELLEKSPQPPADAPPPIGTYLEAKGSRSRVLVMAMLETGEAVIVHRSYVERTISLLKAASRRESPK